MIKKNDNIYKKQQNRCVRLEVLSLKVYITPCLTRIFSTHWSDIYNSNHKYIWLTYNIFIKEHIEGEDTKVAVPCSNLVLFRNVTA